NPLHLHYLDATQMANLLQKNNLGLLSTQGEVNADSKLNILWVHDRAQQIKQLTKVIAEDDQPTPQVYIRAKIVNVDNEYMRTLGVAFSNNANSSVSSSDGGVDGLVIPIAQLGHDVLLEATLDALERSGHAGLISEPQLITLDRETATIDAGE